jgi:hypothetical protein
MSHHSSRERAEQRLENALASTGAEDPRARFRARLRLLRERDERAFRKALDFFENRLVPSVAAEDSDPLAEWLDYGRFLASLTLQGETVQVDPTGRSRPYAKPVPLEALVLHLPASSRERAIPVRLPAEPSPAQRATLRLLVQGGDETDP